MDYRKKIYDLRMKYSDRMFGIVNFTLICLLLVIFVWPLWFVVIAAFSDPSKVYAGEVILWPKGFTLEAFKAVFEYQLIWKGYANTVFYTAVGTVLNLVMTVCAAYPLSREDFVIRKFVFYLMMVTMYFGGGLIPTYLLLKNLHLLNTRWVMIIPGALSVSNVLIVRTYFKNSIPIELYEAATLDGANSFQYLMKVVLPLSKPVLAVVGLYYGVGHWNDFYTALLYLRNNDLRPLQYFLRDILMSSEFLKDNLTVLTTDSALSRLQLAQTLRYSTIIVSIIPVLLVYPFVQKHFTKGVMLGSLKG